MFFVSDATQLVGGDASHVRYAAGRMRQLSGELDRAASGMARLDTQHWQGSAADAFRTRFDPQSGTWRQAADAFDQAARALTSYASAMLDGQTRAARAIEMFRQSLHITAQAKARYDARLNAMTAGPHGIVAKLNPPPFEDPGQALREQAVSLANRAVADTQAVGDQAADSVRAATEHAPPKPSFMDKVGHVVSAGFHDTAGAAEWVGREGYNHVAVPVGNTLYKVGTAIVDDPGDTAQTIAGLAVAGIGAGINGVGFGLDATGVGAPAGLVLNGIGVVVAGAGAEITANGARSLAAQASHEPNIMHATSNDGGTAGRDDATNGGLGELVQVNSKDPAAGPLARRIGGEPSVRFSDGPPNEFDAVSDKYIAQAKPASFRLSQAFRNQAKATFEAALQSGRIPYFQFDGPPEPGVLAALRRYAERYGIQPVIDLTPLR